MKKLKLDAYFSITTLLKIFLFGILGFNLIKIAILFYQQPTDFNLQLGDLSGKIVLACIAYVWIQHNLIKIVK